MPQDSPPAPALSRLILLGLLFATMIAFGVPKFIDLDIWWHLATGQWIWDHYQFPTHDPFSAGGSERPLFAYSWLFELGTLGLYNSVGLYGFFLAQLVFNGTLTILFIRLFKDFKVSFIHWFCLVFALIFIVKPCFTLRPWCFSMIFSILLVMTLIRDEQNNSNTGDFKSLLHLPVIFLFWVNLHIQFVYGLLIIGLWGLGPLCDYFQYHEHDQKKRAKEQFRRYLGLGLICLAATLINPYHIGVYVTVFQYLGQSELYSFITELRSLDFNGEFVNWVHLGLIGYGYYLLGKAKNTRLRDILIFSIVTIMSVRMVRDVWIFSLLGGVIVLRAAECLQAPTLEKDDLTQLQLKAKHWLVVAMIAVGFSTSFILRQEQLPESYLQAQQEKYPIAAVNWLKTNKSQLKGPIFNEFDWGGYLIWNLPAYPVLIDGRTNVHGADKTMNILNVLNGDQPIAPELLNDFGFLLLKPERVLLRDLAHLPGFKQVYADDTAVIFVNTKLNSTFK